MNSSRPKVSVIMGLHNAEDFVAEAVQSILDQDFRDFEFLIFDDASTDRSYDIVRAMRDERIGLFRQKKNLGLTNVLNKGLSVARGEYIARMDADDVAARTRLTKQVSLLDSHPDVGLCAMWYERFPGHRREVVKCPLTSQALKCALFFGNPIGHATVCLRTDLLRENGLEYDPVFLRGQDYDLWDRLAAFTEFMAIPEIGLRYRVHSAQVGAVHMASQVAASETVLKRIATRLIHGITSDELALHIRFISLAPEPSIAFLRKIAAWGERLSLANRQSGMHPAKQFERSLADKWFRTCSLLSFLGAGVWTEFHRSPLSMSTPARETSSLRLFIKSSLRLRGRSGLA